MKTNTVSVFLPVRKGSERVKNKNTRPFAHFNGGLLELKLSQLIQVTSIHEIVLSTDDDASIEIGQAFAASSQLVRIIRRPEHLALSSTNLTDLVTYVPTICTSEHLLWTHATSPFVEAADYDRAISLYFSALEKGCDSLMSVRKFNEYLWSKAKNDLINRATPQRWPRTQDLEELYQIDSAIFLAGRDIYSKDTDRIGKKPELFIQEGIKSFDVDWEDDFNLAEVLYRQHHKS